MPSAEAEAEVPALRSVRFVPTNRNRTLTAWCEVRSDFRVFRADRIETVSPGGGTFPQEDGKTYDAYLAQVRAREEIA